MKAGTPDVKEVPHFRRLSLLAALMIDNNHCALPGAVSLYCRRRVFSAQRICLGVWCDASHSRMSAAFLNKCLFISSFFFNSAVPTASSHSLRWMTGWLWVMYYSGSSLRETTNQMSRPKHEMWFYRIRSRSSSPDTVTCVHPLKPNLV
jgi:hypothetical protein